MTRQAGEGCGGVTCNNQLDVSGPGRVAWTVNRHEVGSLPQAGHRTEPYKQNLM